MNKYLIVLLLLVGLIAAACNRTTTMTVGNTKIEVEIADTQAERSLGLSSRDSLPDDHGMLFVFDSADRYGFWMKDMKFPLDFIWISQGKVIQVMPDIAPQPGVADDSLKVYKPDAAVDQVLEVNAGWAVQQGIKPGDTVDLTN
jgi:uncharacterized protein